jgi:hypothetical protein
MVAATNDFQSGNLARFGWTFDPCVFHSFLVTTGATKQGHKACRICPLEFCQTDLQINDDLINP